MFLNPKSKHIIKETIAHIEKEQGKLPCESISSENPNIKRQKLNQSKRIKCGSSTTSNSKFVTVCTPS